MPFPTEYPRRKKPPPYVPPPPDPWWKALFEVVIYTPIMLLWMAALAVLTPFIKLGLFHWQAYDQWRRGDYGAAIGIFVLGCLAIDVGLIWGAVLVWQGKLAIW